MAAAALASAVGLPPWDHEEYPCLPDLKYIPLFAAFFPLVRFLLDQFLLQRLGRGFIVGNKSGLSEVEIEDRQKKLVKFKESGWKCIYYLSAEIFALAVTYNEPWFKETKFFWVGPGNQVWPDQKIKTKLKVLYMFSGGFYTYSIFALILWETRRSDFGVSMSHHIATLLLIVFSYMARFARVGSVILSLHDASDVFLEVGKMSKYAGSEIIPIITFGLFALSWVLLRLIYFPFWILWSTSYEVLQKLEKSKHKVEGPIYYYLFNTLLFTLLVLHIYWWVLIFRMIVRQFKANGKVGDDVRSDSDGDKDD